MQQYASDRGETMNKPERPNSLGPKLSKRINFYHGETFDQPFSLNYSLARIKIPDQENQKKTPESPMQPNNNSMNNNQMSHDRYHHNTAQLQVQFSVFMSS